MLTTDLDKQQRYGRSRDTKNWFVVGDSDCGRQSGAMAADCVVAVTLDRRGMHLTFLT